MIGADLNEKYDKLVSEMARLAAAMESFEFPKTDQQHSPGYREWEPFVVVDGGVCDGSGNLTFSVGDKPAPNGWEAHILAVSLTVSNSSAAATVTTYTGGAADQNLLDYANAMLGAAPSRLVAFYEEGVIHFKQNQTITFAIAGAVAGASVIARVSGRRRQT